jgi:hypothetical protein
MGTIKTTNIETITGSGTLTLGQSGETISVPSGATLDLSNATQTGVGGVNTPAFFAYMSSDLNVSDNTNTIVPTNSEDYDIGGCFNNTGSSTTLNGLTAPAYSFVPNVAGKYYIGGMINIQGGTSELIESHTNISKNASTFSHAYQANQNNYSNYQTNYMSVVVDLNGTGDYMQLVGRAVRNGSTSAFLADTRGTFFHGYKIIE